MLKNLELTENEFLKLFNFAQKLNLNFISTPYDIKSVKLLKKLNINCFKTASTDLIDLLLHKEIIKTKKPVIISTGASTMSEIKKTIDFYKKINIIKFLYYIVFQIIHVQIQVLI